nr:putative reverse transcriptase domain-containing protein [Tanacetum cinerariifolium]
MERLHGLDQQIERREDGSLYFLDRIWVPLVGGVRTIIMDETHKTRFFVHPEADKMYRDIRNMYWWPGMKRDIAIYVSKCLTCSKVKAEHQRPLGLFQQPETPGWKLDKITIDFITKLPRSPILWAEIRESSLIGPELIQETTDKVEPVEIKNHEVKRLKRSRISLVKVRWNSKRDPEFTWERKDFMKSMYP